MTKHLENVFCLYFAILKQLGLLNELAMFPSILSCFSLTAVPPTLVGTNQGNIAHSPAANKIAIVNSDPVDI